MKLSFSTLGCPDWSWETIVDNAAVYGYEGIEIRGVEGELYLPKVSYFSDLNLKDTLRYLKNREIEVISLNSSVSFHDPLKYTEKLEEARDYIELAEKMGVKYIRIFGDVIREPEKASETLDTIARGLEQVYDMCEGKKCIPLFEVHGSFNNIEIFHELFKRFAHPKFSVIWDIMHSHNAYVDSAVDFFNFIGKYVRHVHIKDCYWSKDDASWKLCEVGKGTMPINKYCNLLSMANYSGYLSLEWEKQWHPELCEPEIAFVNYVNYMKDIL